MKAKEFEIKKRDPNWKAMQDIRRSGAGGQHKDKKKAAKQGEVKHKGQMAEGDEPDEQYLDKVISDLHKDALGFRPDQEFGQEWMSSSFEEKLEIYNNLLKNLHSDMDEDHGPEDPEADYNVGEYDREGDMAKDQLRTINDAAKELYKMITPEENLPEWVQSKITKALDYLDTARDYMKANKYVEDLEEEKQKGLDGKACWKGYRRMGTKMKGGKRVDNCVKVKEDLEEQSRRDYGYDSFGSSLRPGDDEGSTEPPNNFAIYINGKKWKVFQGKGQYADDQYEMQQFRQLQAMAVRKSQETGKKWEVSRTLEPATK